MLLDGGGGSERRVTVTPGESAGRVAYLKSRDTAAKAGVDAFLTFCLAAVTRYLIDFSLKPRSRPSSPICADQDGEDLRPDRIDGFFFERGDGVARRRGRGSGERAGNLLDVPIVVPHR